VAQRKAPGASADDSTLRGSEKGREEARGSLYVCAPVLVTYNEGAARRSSSRLIVHSIRQSTVSLPQRSSASMGHDRSTILFKDEVRLRSAHRTQQRTGGQSFDPVGVVFEGRVLYFYRIPSKACASPAVFTEAKQRSPVLLIELLSGQKGDGRVESTAAALIAHGPSRRTEV
jgi:hypothetical protein